ncbi:MAG: transketolase C-terminal domain-containing protein [Pseudomonadota bacterium]
MSSNLTPMNIKPKLAPNPESALKYSVSAKQSDGAEIRCADPRATRAMVALMDMNAVMGGAASHWGGPAAFAELMSATHALMFSEAKQAGRQWYERFHFVNDAGHCENGLYALKANYGFADLTLEKLKGFRSIDSVLTGHGESHLFPEAVYLSNGPLGSSLPQAQGLAMADALAGLDRVTVTAISDGACMEGEAKEALAAIPGLASKGKLAPFVMIVSDNRTKLSGRIDEDAFAMDGTFSGLKNLGWEVLTLDSGNDLQSCVEVIEKAIANSKDNPKVPVAIHAKTVKGFGVKKTEDSASGGHGFPLKTPVDLEAFLSEIYAGSEVPSEFAAWQTELVSAFEDKQKSANSSGPAKEKVQVGVAKALIDKKSQGLPIVSVSADLQGSTGVAGFHKEFPESSIDVGVAESNMISAGAGLSKQGYIPIVDTFSQFAVTKGALPLTMASLSQAPVIGIYSHAGFQDAADGASHQALTYFSKTCSIPDVDVYSLTTSEEAEALLGQALDQFAEARKSGKVPHSSIFFLGRETFLPSLQEAAPYKLGKAQVVRDVDSGSDKSITLVAAGPLLFQALQAAESLSSQGYRVAVVNPSVINRPDLETLLPILEKTNNTLLTVEDHQVVGGMGALLSQALIQTGRAFRMRCLGVREEFGRSAYKANQLYAEHGLDAVGIEKAARELLG